MVKKLVSITVSRAKKVEMRPKLAALRVQIKALKKLLDDKMKLKNTAARRLTALLRKSPKTKASYLGKKIKAIGLEKHTQPSLIKKQKIDVLKLKIKQQKILLYAAK